MSKQMMIYRQTKREVQLIISFRNLVSRFITNHCTEPITVQEHFLYHQATPNHCFASVNVDKWKVESISREKQLLNIRQGSFSMILSMGNDRTTSNLQRKSEIW